MLKNNKRLHCQHGNGSAPNITSTQVYTFVSRSKLTEVYNKTHPSALSKGISLVLSGYTYNIRLLWLLVLYAIVIIMIRTKTVWS